MARHVNSVPATEHAYLVIRNSILENTLPHGSRITIRGMAELTGVSIIPVIQALHRLENEGLIEIFPNWGSRVITLDRETTRDRYLLREAVECQVARILAGTLTAIQENNLASMAARLDQLSARDTAVEEFWNLDHEFHQTMASYTECQSLKRALDRINLFRLMQKTREQVALAHISLPHDLHMSVVKAIASRDPDVAERQMREHISVSTQGWLNLH
jgi:DNA-binding GntR family transcriptional regulator